MRGLAALPRGLVLAGASLLLPSALIAGTRITADEAVALAFPANATIARHSVVLTRDQLAAASERCGEAIEQELWTRFTAVHEGKVLGWAYLDTHRVRTLAETLLVAVSLSGQVRRIEVVAFAEPPEYLPKQVWFEQFNGRGLDRELDLKRAIRPITGATLSSRAATAAVRRVLAIHQTLTAASPTPGPIARDKQ